MEHGEAVDCAALAKAIASGDRRAEQQLVERFQRGVRVILRRAGVPPATLDDLEQEVFRAAIVELRSGALRDPSRLAGFVAGLARNVGLGSLRERGRHPLAAQAVGDGAPDAAEARPDPLGDLLAQEQAALVRQVLSELDTKRDREVLRRLYLLGEGRERICSDLGLDRRQLDHVLSRARQRYRVLYERRAAS
jgi:RNA polymerase sigma-70 factor (ECF subfamily)